MHAWLAILIWSISVLFIGCTPTRLRVPHEEVNEQPSILDQMLFLRSVNKALHSTCHHVWMCDHSFIWGRKVHFRAGRTIQTCNQVSRLGCEIGALGRLLTMAVHGLHPVNHSVVKIRKVKPLPPSVCLSPIDYEELRRHHTFGGLILYLGRVRPPLPEGGEGGGFQGGKM